MHRLIASAPTPFDALARAHYFSVVDQDFHHADFWRSQVSEAEAALLSTLPAHCLPATRRQILSNAMATGFQIADKSKRFRVVIHAD